MITRYAFFEGHVKLGFEDEFTSFVHQRLLPLWIEFPGAEMVRVMRPLQSDTSEPHYEMILAVDYKNLEAIEMALRSDVRMKSRTETTELMKMFDGRIFHTVLQTDEFVTA